MSEQTTAQDAVDSPVIVSRDGRVGRIQLNRPKALNALDKATMDALEHAGVSYADVVDKLETEGLDKFEKSWEELLGSVRSELEKAGENK